MTFVAMEITGHRTRAIFDRYHIVTERDKTQGIAQLARSRQGQAAAPRTVARRWNSREKTGADDRT